MQQKILPEADKYTKQNHRRRAWQKIVRVMACVVVFCTTYALILPAITMEKPTNCGLEEHVHSEECYEKVTSRPVTELACTYETLGIHQHDEKCRDEEGNLLCDEIDFIVHEHDESCVDESGALVCQLPEIKEHAHTEECWHTHTEACYTTQQGELICQTEESEDHQHTQDCYEQTQVFICELAPEAAEPALICQEPEIQLHTHGADCYRLYIADDGTETTVLTCTKQEVLEHVHSEACFQTVQIPMEDVDTLTCGLEETEGHSHTEECYGENGELTCGLDEAEAHAHTERCYGTWEMTCGYEVEHTHTLECHADKTADLETEETWTANLPQTLTGNWAEDLLAVAKTQVGYSESKKNYIVEADGETVSGYNRYGAWYGSYGAGDTMPYASWDMTFLYFCIRYSGISDFPLGETMEEWVASLDYHDLYRTVGEYAPKAGDLVFLDTDGDGEADRAGLISGLEEENLIAIEGDHDGTVAEVTYALPVLMAQEEATETEATQTEATQTEATETEAVEVAEEKTEIKLDISFLSKVLRSDGSDDTEEITVSQETVVGYVDVTQAQFNAQTVNAAETTQSLKAGDYIYFDAGDWDFDGVKFAIYYSTNEWSDFLEWVAGTIYRTQLPEDWDSGVGMIFARMNPNLQEPAWNDNSNQNNVYAQYPIQNANPGFIYAGENQNKYNITYFDRKNKNSTTGEWDSEWYVSAEEVWEPGMPIYLKTNGIDWPKDEAKLVLEYHTKAGNDSKPTVQLTAVDGVAGLYTANLPNDLDISATIQFRRLNPNGDTKWNECRETRLRSDTNVYELTDWNAGQWVADEWYESSGDDDDGNDDDGGGGTGGETDTLPGIADGCRRVFYDATLSKLSYEKDGVGSYEIPARGTNVIYCWADKQYVMNKLTSYTSGGHTYTDVYYVDIPSTCTKVTFASFALSSATNYGGHGESTTQLTIPSGLSNPCFYGDTSDKTIYDGGTRDGYWGEAFTVRDAEKGKGTDVVDIKNTESFAQNSTDTLYLSTTFFDYYTDYELNGNNRDGYKVDNGASYRNWVPFRQLNQALSDCYESKSVNYPLYVGHFQPDLNYYDYKGIKDTLNLYGDDNYRRFFASNNSILDEGESDINDAQKLAYAMQGLVNSTLVNDSLMASGGTLEFPLFDKDFITGNNSKNTKLGEVYEYVSFPFTKEKDTDGDGVQYWVFDSDKTTLAMRQDPDTNEYYLKSVDKADNYKNVNVNSSDQKTYGFFPFNETSSSTHANTYNYGYGTRIDLKFRLTEDGQVLTNKDTNGDGENDKIPIEFNFSGDDDVWVFIDGKLALDVGGVHQAVTGRLNFATLKATVDMVKYGGTATTQYEPRTTDFTISGAKTDEHTLTMFYMERGMWESNMKITFNFPDENLLEVKKEVDDSQVNALFDGLFDNKSMFTFNIKNLATHYGTQAASGATVAPITPVIGNVHKSYENNGFQSATASMDGISNVIQWYAEKDDQEVAGSSAKSSWRHRRYGIAEFSSAVDISQMNKLSFKMYYEGDNYSLSDLYIQLVDANATLETLKADTAGSGDSDAFGCIGSGSSLNGKTYGTSAPDTGGRKWVTITLDLSKFNTGSTFDIKNVKYIRFGCDNGVNIYLTDFEFESNVSSQAMTGFVTEQSAIPDYGSATSGNLKNAYGAIYASDASKARASLIVDENGNFTLMNNETVSFHDQFRRGSYIYLEEELTAEQDALFDTTWTMFENGMKVTSMVGDGTVNVPSGGKDLTEVVGTVVDDGRKEVYQNDIANSGYTSTSTRPNNTFVFRSYADPDNTTSMTKLKVLFTNKVKTGSLTISKADAGTTEDTKISDQEKFQFVVEFYNVGGLGLESSSTISTEFALQVGQTKTITGIPLNTQYKIYELKSSNPDITISSVSGDHTNYTVTTFNGTEAYRVSGTIDSDGQEVTYTNIQKPVVSLTLTKVWKNSNGEELNSATSTIPNSITVQLQRRIKGDENAKWDDNYYSSQTIQLPPYTKWEDYSFTFKPLDKYVNYTVTNPVEWQYRVVELNSEGKVVDSGNMVTLGQKDYTVDYGGVEPTESGYSQTITNTEFPWGYELPETGGAGTYLYTLGGIVLTAVPLVYGYSQWRRRERRAAR